MDKRAKMCILISVGISQDRSKLVEIRDHGQYDHIVDQCLSEA